MKAGNGTQNRAWERDIVYERWEKGDRQQEKTRWSLRAKEREWTCTRALQCNDAFENELINFTFSKYFSLK